MKRRLRALALAVALGAGLALGFVAGRLSAPCEIVDLFDGWEPVAPGAWR